MHILQICSFMFPLQFLLWTHPSPSVVHLLNMSEIASSIPRLQKLIYFRCFFYYYY